MHAFRRFYGGHGYSPHVCTWCGVCCLQYQTPIDDVDPFVLFAEQLSGLQGRAGPRYVAIMQALAAQAAAGGQDPTATEAALAALFAHAEKLKAEALEAAARRAQ